MAALSALAVSLMFLSQTETSSTRNYRTMSQARYAGEAGVHKAINYLTSSAYVAPTSVRQLQPDGVAGHLHLRLYHHRPRRPVVAGVRELQLSGRDGGDRLQHGGAGDAGDQRRWHPEQRRAPDRHLRRLGEAHVDAPGRVYGGGTGVIQTWEITATGTVPGSLPATVEVTALLERHVVDAQTFAVFATGTGCGAINMNGNAGRAATIRASGRPPATERRQHRHQREHDDRRVASTSTARCRRPGPASATASTAAASPR